VAALRHAIHPALRLRLAVVVLVFYLIGLGLSESQTGMLLTLTLLGDTVVSSTSPLAPIGSGAAAH